LATAKNTSTNKDSRYKIRNRKINRLAVQYKNLLITILLMVLILICTCRFKWASIVVGY